MSSRSGVRVQCRQWKPGATPGSALRSQLHTSVSVVELLQLPLVQGPLYVRNIELRVLEKLVSGHFQFPIILCQEVQCSLLTGLGEDHKLTNFILL